MGNQGYQGNHGNYNHGWKSYQGIGQVRSSNRSPHPQNQQQ